MKASELIRILQKGIEQHGDLEVYTKHYNNVFGKVKRFPAVAYRSKYDVRRQWSGLHEADKGEKVFKV
jgi:hypothetical protein